MRAPKSKRSAKPAAAKKHVAVRKTVSPPRKALAQDVSIQVCHLNSSNKPITRADSVVREEPLEIRVRGQSVAITMRTPGNDAELAAGFLLSEGLICGRGDIIEIAECTGAATPENTLNVFVAPKVNVDFARLTRHVFTSSSCGLCGKASIEEAHQHFPPATSKETISRRILAALPKRMLAAQRTFERTGGLHGAGIFDLTGKLLVLREDVGRHNAVDKALGWGFLEDRLPFDAHVLMVSGRASFEILQKALAAKVPIVAAVSAPSSLAVEFARESNQTLVGFLRGETMNVYSGLERITD